MIFNMKRKFIKSLGFSLIELMVVIAIIGILASSGAVIYSGTLKRTRNNKRETDLESIKQALFMYKSDNGKYPVVSGWETALTTGDYMDEVPQDPQGTSYIYTVSSCDSTGCESYILSANME
jgi:general secretion pathway protein G